jgi:predicted ATPase
LREYAAERLDEMLERDQVRAAHGQPSWTWSRPGVAACGPGEQGLAGARLEAEHNNIRAALRWYRGHDASVALRLAASMAAFWSLRGHHTEGRQQLRELLSLVPEPGVARVSR